MHGGTSRGPATPEGLERWRRARWKHGWYSRGAVEQRRAERMQARDLARLLGEALALLRSGVDVTGTRRAEVRAHANVSTNSTRLPDAGLGS
jgi:hypothetical protein